MMPASVSSGRRMSERLAVSWCASSPSGVVSAALSFFVKQLVSSQLVNSIRGTFGLLLFASFAVAVIVVPKHAFDPCGRLCDSFPMHRFARPLGNVTDQYRRGLAMTAIKQRIRCSDTRRFAFSVLADFLQGLDG